MLSARFRLSTSPLKLKVRSRKKINGLCYWIILLRRCFSPWKKWNFQTVISSFIGLRRYWRVGSKCFLVSHSEALIGDHQRPWGRSPSGLDAQPLNGYNLQMYGNVAFSRKVVAPSVTKSFSCFSPPLSGANWKICSLDKREKKREKEAEIDKQKSGEREIIIESNTIHHSRRDNLVGRETASLSMELRGIYSGQLFFRRRADPFCCRRT